MSTELIVLDNCEDCAFALVRQPGRHAEIEVKLCAQHLEEAALPPLADQMRAWLARESREVKVHEARRLEEMALMIATREKAKAAAAAAEKK